MLLGSCSCPFLKDGGPFLIQERVHFGSFFGGNLFVVAALEIGCLIFLTKVGNLKLWRALEGDSF